MEQGLDNGYEELMESELTFKPKDKIIYFLFEGFCNGLQEITLENYEGDDLDNSEFFISNPQEIGLACYFYLPDDKEALKKYISYSDSRAFISDYDGPAPINKVPSNWQATELTELDVPDLTVQTGAKTMWPSHWPGNHSPMIIEAVMQAGEINGRQIIDPRTKDMRLQLDIVNYHIDMEAAIMLRARYEELKAVVKSNPAFTYGDSSLVNMIIGKINIL